MISLEDIDNIEGDEASPLEYFKSIQRAINSGSAWSLQGSYGRSMMDAINAGSCMLGESRARDYYGSRIPSRSDVEAGTKGSREFVVKNSGEDWAKAMEEV